MNVVNDIPPARAARSERFEADQQLLRSLGVHTDALSRSGTSRLTLRALTAIGAVGVVVAGTGAAVVVVGDSEPSQRTEIECHSTEALGYGGEFDGTSAALGQPQRVGGAFTGAAVDINAPLEVCGTLWRQGFLKAGSKNPENPAPDEAHPVPPLVACVTRDGGIAVFPSKVDLCAALGLHRLAP